MSSQRDRRDVVDLPDVDAAHDDWPLFDLQYVIDCGAEGEQCTIYPPDATDEELLTRWLSADDGSYIDVRGTR